MKKEFLEKCDEVFLKTNRKEISEERIKELQAVTGRAIAEEYRYILNNYSCVFLRDDYELCSKYKSPMADENGAEPFLYFVGLEGDDNIFGTYDMYKEQLPDSFCPIALADGGNLICINDSSENIYLWIHDDAQNTVYKIFDSFEEMVMMIRKFDHKEDSSGVIEVDLSEEFLAALNALK